MKNKYTMVWTTSLGYMPGTNAILNALEFYKFGGIDVYVLVDDLKQLSPDYGFEFHHINFHQIDYSFWPESKSHYWYMVFADFDFALRHLFDEYRVVLFWGADVCVVNNFQRWFEVADRLDTVILGTNEQYGGNPDKLSRLTESWPYLHTWDVPYTDIPIFIPASQRQVIQKTFDYQKQPGCAIDRMDGLNYAVRDLRQPVFSVPGAYWIFNVPMMAKLDWSGNHLYLHGTRMESFHRKYWDPAFCKSYFGNVESELKTGNIMTLNRIWNYFNKEGRVKWSEGVELWDGK